MGLLAFADGPLAAVDARARPAQLRDVLARMARLAPEGGTDVARGLAGLPDRLARRGLVVFVSDCLADPAEITALLRLFRARGHEVIVFQVLSPEERDFDFTELTEFVDAETGARLLTHPADLRPAYLEALRRHTAEIAGACAEMNVDFVELRTDTRLDRALVDYLAKRRRVR